MRVIFIGLIAAGALGLVGCNSTTKAMTQSASGKNLNLDGYVMVGDVEASNADTGTPQGRLIIGRVTYKSRRVGIPADQKVPTTGYFKATETESLFGTKEKIVEYDFTAGSDKEAEMAMKVLEEKRRAAMEQKTEEAAKTNTEK